MTTDAEIRQLANGAAAAYVPAPGSLQAALTFRLAGGVIEEPADRLGLTRLTELTVFKGTKEKGAREVFDEFDRLGVERSSATGSESITFAARFLPRHMGAVMQLYSDVFRKAAFPEKQVEISKQIARQELNRLDDAPMRKTLHLLVREALGDPLGRITLGTEPGIAAVEADDVRNHWRRLSTPLRLQVSCVAGEISADDFFEALEQCFGSWKSESGLLLPLPITVREGKTHVEKSSEQVHIAMAYPGAGVNDPEYFVGRLALAVLSGGGSSRLFQEVREKRGLVYSVWLGLSYYLGGGLTQLYAGTTADRADETLRVCLSEIERVGEELTDEELDRARMAVKGPLLTTGEVPGNRVAQVSRDLFCRGAVRSLQETVENLERVTASQVREYVAAHPPTPLSVLTLGPKEI